MPLLPKKKTWKWEPKPKLKNVSWSNPQALKFYNSSAWRKLRRIVLSQSPWCVKCGKPATVVDHIIELDSFNIYDTHGGTIPHPLDESNLQTLCVSCHNSKTGKWANSKSR
jgi:5-methylcytosine-specific restriction endonuclease McrA